MLSDAPWLEALQEAHVVLEEDAQILDAVAQHRDPVRAHPEREALVPLRIEAAVAQHDRMNHSGTEDGEPAGPPARGAAAAAADQAADVERHGRLREWVVAGPETRSGSRPEHRPGELVEQTAQMGEGRAFIDHQTLDLEELEAVARVDRLVTEAAAR